MNRGLLVKTLREAGPSVLVFALGLFAAQVLLALILGTFGRQLAEQWVQMKFVQNVLSALLGTEMGAALGPKAMASIAWVHPMVLALVWAHAILFCTRVPAGELDRGTIDVLLALPVSRTRLYVSESCVWLTGGLLIVTMGLIGNIVGRCLVGREASETTSQLLAVSLNLYALYIAVGGGAWLVSALSDRRGRAVGVLFAILVVSFFLNSMTAFHAGVKRVSFLSVLTYYRPLRVLQGSSWPTADMMVLLGVGVVLWLAGAIVFARRDIRTV